jgi:hypothetical protein
MKFVSLGRERTHRQGKLLSHPTLHLNLSPSQSPCLIKSTQHPEWVQANGESPPCDSYESRLMHLLDAGWGI